MATRTVIALCAVAAVVSCALRVLEGGVAAEAANTSNLPALAVTPSGPQRLATFRDRLVVGLRARLPAEIAFVNLVVQRVQTGRLPQRMVDSTYYWARSRAAGRTRRPMIYFQPAMTARAKRVGVAL